MKRALRSVVALGLALALIAAACGDDSGSSSVAPTTTSAPKSGGTLTFGLWSPTTTLDPIGTSGVGTSGGIELNAIYDLVVEFNPVTKQYDPKTAESLNANADFTEWTLKLRPNIKFTDGTAYDAAAIKFNFERHKDNANVRGLLAAIKEIQVVDPLTVKFVLTESWAGFPIVFNNSTGNIVSPAAASALGKDGIAKNPVGAGAGPFIVEAFLPGESLTLKRNPDYWGGQVYLDRVVMKVVGNGSITFESLKSGGVDAAFLRDPIINARARSEGLAGFDVNISSGEMLLLNLGVEVTCSKETPAWACTGKPDGTKVPTAPPTKDLKVRQAIQAALDLKAIDARVNEGKGLPATSLMDASFPWDPKVSFPAYELDKAKRLVSEAKAAGWNGTVRLSCGVENPQREATVLAVEALLGAAGIQLDKSKANIKIAEQISNVITNKDFDISCWGLQMTPDDDAVRQIEQFLKSTSASNRGGYKNPAMDAALAEMKRAGDDQSRTAAWKKVAELWNQDVISIPLSHTPQGVFWSGKVQGVKPVGLSSVVLDKAWINA
jgi:peptide/nickel transport system substrate-binding protein